MGRRLLSKSHRVNDRGELLVDFAADREDGAQVGRAELPDQDCVPFSTGTPLGDRKYLIITFTTDRVDIGRNPVSTSTSYISFGSGRGDSGTAPPRDTYSNRKQFLRGQYMHLAVFPAIEICANATTGAEDVTSLELS